MQDCKHCSALLSDRDQGIPAEEGMQLLQPVQDQPLRLINDVILHLK